MAVCTCGVSLAFLTELDVLAHPLLASWLACMCVGLWASLGRVTTLVLSLCWLCCSRVAGTPAVPLHAHSWQQSVRVCERWQHDGLATSSSAHASWLRAAACCRPCACCPAAVVCRAELHKRLVLAVCEWAAV